MPLAYHFGLKPWELDRLRWWEFSAFCTAIDDMARQNQT